MRTTRTLFLCAVVLWMQASGQPFRPLGTFTSVAQCHDRQRQLQLPWPNVCLPGTLNPNQH